ncbi:DUF3431 domain-containing protein [Aspergillus affinis]|uniref:DUF3431 domain-containing protein n=1 Tax=Aspergillus affinis TaxID=1070780 RepID=UPI0022FE3FED|nr:uncharacterized protein KD926_006192 [Aspergillus affinis]KAI9042068.1 hypothetical protein KD926_006192 [Aspergillus affinis]
MRSIERLGAAICVLLTMLWIMSELRTIQIRWQDYLSSRGPSLVPSKGTPTRLHTSSTGHRRPSISDLSPSRGEKIGSLQITIDEVASTDIMAMDRIIVVGKMKHEQTEWIAKELPEWRRAVYTVDDPTAPLRVTKNKGKEANVYLRYIIDHYHNLPSIIVFLHSHRDGWPEAWHTEFEEHSNVNTIQLLQTDFVQQNGYTNLRCNHNPGCPDEIRPFREPRDESRLSEIAFADAWKALFNSTDVPGIVASPCCAQFAVSRDQVLKRPLASYVRYHRWLMDTNLPDDISGRVMEYMWHVIFGQDPVHCPDMDQCFQDVYGI